MHSNYFGRFLLTVSYALNIGLWTHHFHIALKIGYAVLLGFITILGGINQWNVFKKTYSTLKIVIVIDQVITWVIPKRKPKKHRNHSIHNKYP